MTKRGMPLTATFTLAAFVAEVVPSLAARTTPFRFLLEVDDFRSRLSQDAGGQVVQDPDPEIRPVADA